MFDWWGNNGFKFDRGDDRQIGWTVLVTYLKEENNISWVE